MRLRIELGYGVVQIADDRVLAGCEFVQLGILKVEIALSHGAFHVSDGVAHHGNEACLWLRECAQSLNGRIHFSGVEHRGVMASAAPLRGLGADDVLHVLDRFANTTDY